MCDEKPTTDQPTADNEDHEVTLDVLVLMPGRYEEEADRHGWWNYWRLMVDSLRRGGFDSSLFEDMALYTMVKTNTFNGIRLPSLWLRSGPGAFRRVRSFGYDDFRSRL